MQNAKLKMKICNLQFAIDQRGFTLVELLIAMAIASVVGMAGVAVFSSSNWAYKLNEDVAEAQQNARVSMERLSKDIRAAGFGLPDPPLPDMIIGGQTLSSPITVTTSGGTGNPDSITILGIGYEAGILRKGTNADCNDNGKEYICICRTSADCPNDNDKPDSFFSSSSPFDYQSTRRYISLDGTKFFELSSTATDHARSSGSGAALVTKMKLSSPATLDRNYTDGTPIFIIQAVTYSIETTGVGCSSLNPCLKSNDLTGLRGSDTQTIAESIEDIQFAYLYGVDTNADGIMDSTILSNDPTDDSTIVAVRATVVAKARNKDMRGATFTRPLIEDHDPSAPDNYRRRILTKILKARNPRTGF